MKNLYTQKLLLNHTINELGITNTTKNTIKLLNLHNNLLNTDIISRVIHYFKSIKYDYTIKEILEIVQYYKNNDSTGLLNILSKKDLEPQQCIDLYIVLNNK